MPTEPKSIGDLFVGFRPGGVFDHWKFPTGKLVDFTGFDALQIRAVFDFLGDRARPRGGREYFSWRLQPLVDTLNADAELKAVENAPTSLRVLKRDKVLKPQTSS